MATTKKPAKKAPRKRKSRAKTPKQRKNKKAATPGNERAAGRPKKEIDYEQLQRLCQIQCTLEEVAGFFEVSEDTIENRCKEHYGLKFTEVFKIYSSAGKISLRREQMRQAQAGNVNMLIWLGKNILGQKDKHDHTVGKRVDYRDVKDQLDKTKDPAERSRILTDFIMQTQE